MEKWQEGRAPGRNGILQFCSCCSSVARGILICGEQVGRKDITLPSLCPNTFTHAHSSSYPDQWEAVKSFIISLLLLSLPSVCHGPSTVTPGRSGGA